jgi:hypothetical protein
MRSRQPLQTDWYVSISPADAALAASGAYDPAALEMAGDPENHPRLIDLPGDIEVGLRPLNDIPDGEPFAAHSAKGERLPCSWLSYAKTVAIPADFADQTIFLHLDNARYHVTVTVNGREVGQYRGGWEPHRLEITDAVTPGKDALIVITVGNSGVSGHQEFDPFIYTGTRLPTWPTAAPTAPSPAWRWKRCRRCAPNTSSPTRRWRRACWNTPSCWRTTRTPP